MLDPKEQEKLLTRRFGSAAPLLDPQPEGEREAGPELVPGPPPASPISRWWMTIPLCIGIWAGFALTQNSERIVQVAQSRPIRTVTADRGDIRKTIRIAGDTAASNVAAVRAPRIRGRGAGGVASGGQMTLVKLAAAGSRVKKGTLVAEFDTQNQLLKLDDQKAKVVQEEAKILKVKATQAIAHERERVAAVKAESDLGKAKLDLRTTEVKSAIVAARLQMAVEEAEVNLEAAQKELRLADNARRAELRSNEILRDQELVDQKRAEMNIDRMRILAPIDGMVVLMSNTGGSSISEIEQGDQVRPGMHLLNIVDTASMALEAAVNQADSQIIRTGMPAEVRLDAYPDAVYPARIAAVGSLAGKNTGGGGGKRGGRGGFSRSGGGNFLRNIAIEIAILSKDERVIPDLSASADIIVATAEDVVRVPREAVSFEADGAWVQAAGGDAEGFERRRIEVGLVSDIHVEAVSGLDPGAKLAAERPQARL